MRKATLPKINGNLLHIDATMKDTPHIERVSHCSGIITGKLNRKYVAKTSLKGKSENVKKKIPKIQSGLGLNLPSTIARPVMGGKREKYDEGRVDQIWTILELKEKIP